MKSELISIKELIDAIESSTVDREVMVPSNDFYDRTVRADVISFVDPYKLISELSKL